MSDPPSRPPPAEPAPGTPQPEPPPVSAAGSPRGGGIDLHRLLIESVRDYAIFALDTEGHVRTWNPGARRFKGYEAEEIVGRNFSVFYPPEDVAAGKPRRGLQSAERDGSYEDEGWRVRKDGSRFWASVVITALRDEAGALVGFAKVTRDVSARRETEERLRQSEERFRLLVQSVRDYAIFMLDPDGRVATWNAGAQRIKGYTAEEIVGRHFSTFYPAERVATGFPDYELREASRTGRFEDEGWRLRRDGSAFWANVVITALRNESGELLGFAKVTRDLTERRQAQERALADARRMAEMEAANRAKSEFLTTLSHELRTPLNAIGGYTDLLEMGVAGALNEEQIDYLRRVRTSQRHLLGLVDDLLNLSRVEGGRVEYHLEAVELQPLLQDLHAMVLPQANAGGLTIRVERCPAGTAVWADAGRTQQVILNLLSNAVKFTPAGGRVTVACGVTAEVEGAVEIRVADTGPGIPAEEHESIFEPFVQPGRSLAAPREGIGLGLALSRELARGMGGDLRVESEPGAGSTFILRLPVPPPAKGGEPGAG